MRVLVAEMVLAKLAAGVTLHLEKVGNGRCPFGNPLRRTRHPDGQQPGAKWMLSCDERRATCRAALLGVGVSEESAFLGYAVDVRRFVAHQAEVIGTDIVNADVIASDDEDVGLFRSLSQSFWHGRQH